MADTTSFAAELSRLRAQRGLSLRELAAEVHHGKSYIHDLETGRRAPTEAVARRLDDALSAGGRLIVHARPNTSLSTAEDGDAQIDALELLRRVTASDVSAETLLRLEAAKDQMAMAYATTPPERLLPQVRRHLTYATSLVDARKTLDQLAGAADHREIAAWCLETRAWDVLTSGDFPRALELSQAARMVAPLDSSAHVQATAQEGRAWARLGERVQTGRALNRVERLAEGWATPDHPEHHYQYDPAKAHAYAATTLAWVGDPAAEAVARDVIAELEAEGARPRRVASARLDLGLALLGAGKPDEAAGTASEAISSGRIVPSNWWRVTEIVTGVCRAGVAEGIQLTDQYEAFRPS